MPNVGATIRQLREERGLTQGRLASYAGIDQSYLSKIENGLIGSVGVEIAGRIAHSLGVTVDYLLEQAQIEPSGKTIREVVKSDHGIDLDRLAVLAAHDENIRRIITALPDVPGHEREMLGLFVQVVRDRYRSNNTSPVPEPV